MVEYITDYTIELLNFINIFLSFLRNKNLLCWYPQVCPKTTYPDNTGSKVTKKTFHFKGHSLEIVFSWAVVMSYTPQHWPIFCTKLVFGGVVYPTIVGYSFTQSGDPIQNYFLSSAFSEATITGNMTFSHTSYLPTRLRVLLFWPDCGSFPFIHCSPPPLGLNAIYNPPPIEHCPAPFVGLTVQPCGEPCGSFAGFDLLTGEVIEIKKKSNCTQRLNMCQWLVPYSMLEKFRLWIY